MIYRYLFLYVIVITAVYLQIFPLSHHLISVLLHQILSKRWFTANLVLFTGGQAIIIVYM